MAISKIAVHGQQTTINQERNMKPNAFKIVLLSSAIAGLAGMAGTISAQTFTATATVQNAVSITQVTPLAFGTVFATKTNLGSTSVTEDATHSRKLTLATDGSIAAVSGTVTTVPQMLSLGGQTAGSFSAPGLPSNGTVGVAIKTANGNAFTNATAAAATCLYNTPTDAITADKIILQNGADPTTGFFCVDAFTSNLGTGATALIGGATGYSLGFGVTTLAFDLGATLVGQAPIDAFQRNFAAGAYTGSFQMEVTFP